MSDSMRYELEVVKVDESDNLTTLEDIVISQDYDDTTEKCKTLKSINEWVELPIASNCKLVKFEADAGLYFKEGLSGTEQLSVTFYLKKGTMTNSFYVKNTTGSNVDIKWNTLGEE